MSDPIVGIDLGTSNSVVAYADAGGGVKVLGDAGGYKIHPSVVSFHPNGGVVVGAPAKQRKVIDPKNTIYSAKRLIGRAYSSPEVKIARKRMPYVIKEGPNELPLIATRAGEFAVPEISAIVLDHVRNVAAAALGVPVNRAVVTVPASFNDAQRSATATAGAIAGLTVVRVLNEPTAAALAYGHTRNLNQTIAVYDFGGGTFDITILRLADQVYEVLGTAGDTFLGGDDLDERLVDRMVNKFLAENRVDLRTNEVSMMRLRAVAEQTKIELSRRSRAVVRVDEIAYGPNGKPLNLMIEITRDELVAQVADIIDKTFPVCKEALAYAGLGVDRIDDVILVGGTTKIPYVRDQVSRFFGKAPRTDVNPEDAVALGAALQATSLERILNKGASQRIAVPPPPADDLMEAPTTSTSMPDMAEMAHEVATMQSFTELSSPPVLPPRPTPAARPSDRNDTSYLHPRTGTREVFEERTPPPAPTPVPQGAIGRLKPRAPTPPETLPLEPPRPPARRAPSAPARQAPPPGDQWGSPDDFRTNTSWSRADDFRTPPAQENPLHRMPAPPAPAPAPPAAARPPAGPPPVPVAPPSAPTMMAQVPIDLRTPSGPAARPSADGLAITPAAPSPSTTALGFGPLDLEVPPSSTARGFAPPVQAPPAQAPVIMEVTPRGLGIATVAGFCEELIRRNSRLPTEKVKLFSTSRDLQESVRIVITQGESRRLDNNVVIGDLRLEKLIPRRRGETSIEVTFALDASGILQVTARDAQTGQYQRASLDLVGGIREQDVLASRERIQQLRR